MSASVERHNRRRSQTSQHELLVKVTADAPARYSQLDMGVS